MGIILRNFQIIYHFILFEEVMAKGLKLKIPQMGLRGQIASLTLSGVSLFLSFFHVFPNAPFDLALIAVALCGAPIVWKAFVNLITRFNIKAGFLVSLALLGSLSIGETFAAGEIAFLLRLGKLLEALTLARARSGIEKLIKALPTTARIVTATGESVVSADAVRLGDVLRVLPGEKIPVDGVVISGRTSIDQSAITGESTPVDKEVGDETLSGSINCFGAFEMRATKVGEDSSIQRAVALVRSADARKAKIVGLADRLASYLACASLLSALVVYFVTGDMTRAVTMTVVFCPCALVLATPTAIVAAIGCATKRGVLIKEGDALERLAQVKRVAFDKTGTLTRGDLKVANVESFSASYSRERLYELTASVEHKSEHPLGKAVASSYLAERSSTLLDASEFEMFLGRGVRGRVDGLEVCAGNARFMTELGIAVDARAEAFAQEEYAKGRTAILVAFDGTVAGGLSLSDTLRPESCGTIRSLSALGLEPTLLTGDRSETANRIASELGLSSVCANCLPQEKLDWIEARQAEGTSVCMVGDGVNDAPSLKSAFVGVAMGGIGSDIAVEAADVALTDDQIGELPFLFALAKKTSRKIAFNLVYSLAFNTCAVILAASGALSPALGAIVHNVASIFVVLNSATLLKFQFDRPKE